MAAQWELSFIELPAETPPEDINEALMGPGAEGWEPWHLSRSKAMNPDGLAVAVFVIFLKRQSVSPLLRADGRSMS